MLVADLGAGHAASPSTVAIASLAGHFRTRNVTNGTPDAPADVVVVTSSTTRWPREVSAAIASGVRGVIVDGVGDADGDDLAHATALAADRGIPVVVDTGGPEDQSWRDAVAVMRDDCAAHGIVESLVRPRGDRPNATLMELLVQQLALLRDLLPLDTELALARRTASTYSVCGHNGDAIVCLAGSTAVRGTPQFGLTIATLARRWRLELDDLAPASPTLIERHDESGSLRLPLAYEVTARAAWLSLYAAVVDGAPVRYGLAELGADRGRASALLELRPVLQEVVS